MGLSHFFPWETEENRDLVESELIKDAFAFAWQCRLRHIELTASFPLSWRVIKAICILSAWKFDRSLNSTLHKGVCF